MLIPPVQACTGNEKYEWQNVSESKAERNKQTRNKKGVASEALLPLTTPHCPLTTYYLLLTTYYLLLTTNYLLLTSF